MALAKQVVGIDFTGGLDNRTDEKLVVPGKVTVLENGVFDTANTISKGGQYQQVTTTSVDGSSIGAAASGAAVHNDELLLEVSNKLRAVVKGGGGAPAGSIEKTNNFVRTAISVEDVVSSERDQTEFDAAHGAAVKISVWAWVEGGSSLYYSAFDETSGAVYRLATRLSTTENRPRVLWDSGASVFRIYSIGTGGTLRVYTLNPATPAASLTGTTIASDAQGGSNSRMDAIYNAADDAVWVAYRLAAGGFKVVKLTGGSTVAASRSEAAYTPTGIAVARYSSEKLCVAVMKATEVDVYAFPAALSSSATVNVRTAAGGVWRVTVIPSGANARVIWEEGGATVNPLRHIRKATVSDTPAVTSAAEDIIRSVGLASKPFAFGDDIYIAAVFYSDYQPAVYVINTEGVLATNTHKGVVARALYGTAGRYRTDWAGTTHIPAVLSALKEADSFSIPVLRRGGLRLVNGSDVSPSGIAQLNVFFGRSSRPVQAIQVEDLLVFAGGNPLFYDGQNVGELGHHGYPDPLDFSVTNVAGGSLPAGTYGVVLVWETTDAAGRRWQSAPAVSESVTLGANEKIRVTAPTDRLTRHDSFYAITRLVVYRTEANGTIYYRDTPSAGDDINDSTVDSRTLDYNTVAATLVDNEVLYTTGGILDNDAFPAFRVATVFQGRLVMGGLENPFEVRYTEALRAGQGLATSTVYSLTVPSSGGEVTGLAVMDDKLFIFAERAIWFVFGRGPNRLGDLDGYSDPQVASVDMGCKMASPYPVVTPDGIWFRADQGLRLLLRNLTVARDRDGKFAGAEVDTSVNGLVAALVEPGKQLARFYTGTVVLVFDYQWRQWSKFTNHTAVVAVAWRGTLAHVRSDATVYELGGSTHAGTAIALAVETSWLKFAGLQGFQRIYRFMCLGTFRADSTFSLEVGYNYEAAYQTAVTVGTGGLFNTSIPLQLEHHLPKQKCEAVRFRITESGGSGAGFALTNFAVEVGLKQGRFKMPSTRRI